MNVDLILNGEPTAWEVAEPRMLLTDAIRELSGLTGTHLGCEQGACGACTVLLDGNPVRSCLLFAVQVQGGDLVTVEGLSQDGRLHPVQAAFQAEHALQCGFCTPGFLMAAAALIARDPSPERSRIESALSGNLCRCTGYRNIVRAIERAGRATPSSRPATP